MAKMNLSFVLRLFGCTCFCFFSHLLQAQQTKFFTPRIQTVSLTVNEDFRLPALLRLSSDDRLELSFDHLTHESHRLRYTLTHCTAEWEDSRLSDSEFLDGFNDRPIEDYAPSSGTTLPYIHYRLTLPNEEVAPKLSGNYRISVYDEDLGSPDTPLFTACFRVVEPQVAIHAQVSSDTDIDRNLHHQQVSFRLNHRGYTIRHPQQELNVQVLQNNRTDNSATRLQPSYVGSDELRYEHNRSLIFPAGNEYRRFETTAPRHSTLGVAEIRYHRPYYHATLQTDEARSLNYLYDQDQNGRYLIRTAEATDADTEADYFLTHFSLRWDKPLAEGAFYLEGDLTNHTFDKSCRLTYNPDTRAYECTLLLKQGAYNYQYLYLSPHTTVGSPLPAEGNHHETANEYLVLVYHRPFGSRYDHLIGTALIKE